MPMDVKRDVGPVRAPRPAGSVLAPLGFIEIPAGPFMMGDFDTKLEPDLAYLKYSEMVRHEVVLPRYLIGRWPVTVAQFRAFVVDRDNGGFVPENPLCMNGVKNYPVGYVSWFEALKYCRWLTKRLREWQGTPEPLATLLRIGDGGQPWRVTLPSEAEWEKAGNGFWVKSCLVYGREKRAVGCSRAGGRLHVEDLCGNVMEWTRSLWGPEIHNLPGWPTFKHPYEPDYAGCHRENVKAEPSVLRVVRGTTQPSGNTWDGSESASHRYGALPAFGDRLFGFRAVVSPFLADL